MLLTDLCLSCLLHSGGFCTFIHKQTHHCVVHQSKLSHIFTSHICLAAAPEVLQSGEQTSHPGVTVTLGCSMAPGFSMSSYTMLWYRQTLYGTPIEYLTNEFEKVVGRFQSFLDASNNNFSLEITKLLLNDSGTYYCAASHILLSTFDVKLVHCANYEAHFGQGTKLTVLEYNVTAPTVKILPPSSKECKNKKKTLVCVASGFYPDHVSVFWQIDEVTETNGVATDNNAVRKNESYSITSRLRVSAKDWRSRTFTCTVTFFNGTDYKQYSDSLKEETLSFCCEKTMQQPKPPSIV
uniref:Ig-like domain-containing protein n=1 Tax=Myripristis murdjan TaxID=586833 RepID=A0A667YSW6_9TELE